MSIEFINEYPTSKIFECISGSKAYGLDTSLSDTDIRGVFCLPRSIFYGLEQPSQLNNPTNDLIFYEVKRFIELLAKNNPNILELLYMPKDCILFQHPIFEKFHSINFLSKMCKETFAGYAMIQVKKARGLNKKILNPISKKRKTVLDFCYVLHQGQSIALQNWLQPKGWKQERCGLVSIDNVREIYALFYDENRILGYKGIMQNVEANELLLSSIPKNETLRAYLTFNQEGYSAYCREYKAYWEWVEKRNDARYQNTLSHGKNYDSKNMMHTFRLLDMAKEIALQGEIIVKRPNRDFLFEIRNGYFEYDDLLQIAAERIIELDELFAQSMLPDTPNILQINGLLIEIREELYDSIVE